MTVQTCKRCLYTTDHPLGLIIDEHGICSGCRIHEEKDRLDWEYRWSRLEHLVRPYRSADKRNYDCIVPVSGAQDSYYILHIVKERLKLNPLLVTYNKYWNTPIGIRNLANLRIRFNCDILTQNVNPVAVRKITRETLRNLGSIYWHCIAGQTVFPVQTAVRYRIPLIIWGAHQGVEQVGMFSHEDEVEMTRRYRKEHDLMGLEADDLVTYFNALKESDIWQYRYPDDQVLNEIGVRGIYLSNFVRWDPLAQHRQMVDMYDYRPARFSRTFDIYDYVDCFNYMNLHDRIKFRKHGYSKVTDHASREIRHGRLSRDVASGMVNYYSDQPSNFEALFYEWLGVDERSFNFSLDAVSRFKASDELGFKPDAFYPEASDAMDFSEQKSEYITIGKGWPG